MRRLSVRLLIVFVLLLIAVQVAFGPIGFVRWTPEFHRPQLRLNLGLDLQGGSHLVLEGQDTATIKATPDAVDAAMRVIESRIDQLGVTEPTIQRQGSRRIIVELPGIQDPERAIALIGKTALLEFVDTQMTSLPQGARWSADGKTVTLPPGAAATRTMNLEKKVVLTGADLADAQASFDQNTTEPIVSFQFKGKGAKTFEDFTGANVGKYLTIVLDNEVISSPVIRDRISGGRGQISGGYKDISAARDLAVLLRGGALPIPVEVVENRTIGPLLGRDSIDRSLAAGAVAAIMVVAFMALYYGFAGVVADIALVLYQVAVLALLAGLHATLTLPGIAGIILSIGMAVDGNVIIYEKVKEELRAGKTLRTSIDAGWRRALVTIVDSNVTTLLAAAVLFALGTGPVRGFAVTLTIGIVVHIYTATVVTRSLVDAAVQWGAGDWIMRMAGRRAAVERA